MYEITTQTLVMGGFALLAGVCAVMLFFRADDRKEKRRGETFDIANEFAKIGLDDFVPLFRAYTIGDYTGVAGELKMLLRTLGNPAKRKVFVQELFDRQIRERFEDSVEKKRILDLIAKLTAEPAATVS